MSVKLNFKNTALIALFFFVISFLIVYVVGSRLSAASPMAIGPIPSTLVGEEVIFSSGTGNTLSGWLIKGREDFGGVLLMHGVRSNRRQMIDRAVLFSQIGYTVLLFDFQAHGESQGERITFGHLESMDAEAAFTFLKQQIDVKKIGVIGISLGGAAAILGDVSNRAEVLVLEAVYPTLHEAVNNRVSMRLGMLSRFLTPLLMAQVEPRLGFNPYKLSPVGQLPAINTPLLIIAGTEDRHTTLSQSERMFNEAAEPKQFWAVEGAGHEDYFKYSPVEYREKILALFEQYL